MPFHFTLWTIISTYFLCCCDQSTALSKHSADKKLCLFKLCLRRNGKLHTKGSDFPTSCKQEKVQSNKFFCSSKNTWVTLSSGRKCSLPCSSSPDSENVLMEDFYLWRWDFLGHVMRGKALFNKKKKKSEVWQDRHQNLVVQTVFLHFLVPIR